MLYFLLPVLTLFFFIKIDSGCGETETKKNITLSSALCKFIINYVTIHFFSILWLKSNIYNIRILFNTSLNCCGVVY